MVDNTVAEFFICVILAGVAAWAGLLAIWRRRERQRLWHASGMRTKARPASPLSWLLISMCHWMLPLASMAGLPRNGEKLSRMIAAAGLDESIDAAGFCAMRLASSMLTALAFIALFNMPLPLRAVLGAALGWFAATLWLRAKVRRRRAAIELELPGALDWLALSVEAGLDFAEALGRIAARLKNGPLKSELARLESAIRMGTQRREALAVMGRRACVPALSSFCSLLIQADALGGGIGPVLRTLSVRLRAERFAQAERKGVAAQQKALIPLAICIMPATFIVIFGPLIVRLATGGLGALF
ncbi:MAG: type II secretion system F family protein [Pseudomonadota bacterium]